MKVYNQDKTQILEEYDLDKGYLKEDTLITHYEEVKEVEEQFHYEIIAEYPNGGKEVEKVIDVEGVEYKPARDEEEKIYVYVPYSEAQLQKMDLENEYEEKMEYMNETDYVASKLSEAVAEYIANGDSTNVIVLRANYKEVLEKRQQYRDRLDEIKELFAIY